MIGKYFSIMSKNYETTGEYKTARKLYHKVNELFPESVFINTHIKTLSNKWK